MGIETIILVLGVIVAVAISVGVAKSRRKIHTGSSEGHDPSVDPPMPPHR